MRVLKLSAYYAEIPLCAGEHSYKARSNQVDSEDEEQQQFRCKLCHHFEKGSEWIIHLDSTHRIRINRLQKFQETGQILFKSQRGIESKSD